ncbi:MAG: ABC transporter permease [Deltaproteobacteria bacterium]|nr:ABC transporter permease [Deltaproteobacteria bacterium]
MAKPTSKQYERLISAPSFFWLVLFFVIPTVVVFAAAFRPADPFGGLGPGWTLESLKALSNPNYPKIVWRTLWLSAVTTLICLGLSIPCAYYIASARPRVRNWLLLLVIVPFWTSFLVRVFAWKLLLHPEGWIKRALMMIGLVAPQTSLLYNPEAVLLVMVYSYLPFAILPIYSAVEKFDYHLIEAARDLGASKLYAFWRVFIPGISRGLLTATLVVFIPALGSYIIPDLVGGPNSEMIGNKIAQRTFTDRHLPHASALSALLTLAVLLPMLLTLWLQRRKGRVSAVENLS